MIFLIDNHKEYSYNHLLDAINNDSTYCPYFQNRELFPYFCNLIKGLIGGGDLVLIDSDVKDGELAGVFTNAINRSVDISTKNYLSVEALILDVQKSNSKITIFTSGTTGQPKKVTHNISTLTRSVRTGERYQNQIWGYAYNPTHMAGLQVFFQAFENQNTLVNIFNCGRQVVYDAIGKYNISHISATPTFYRLLLPFDNAYNSVERVTLGGEKSEQSLYESIKKIFPKAKINNIYASTEAGSLFAAKENGFQIPETIKDKVKVENQELLIHKSLLGESDSFSFDNDYYHTGDLIEWLDQNTNLFRFVSRKNELINVGGYKVNPGEVEESIMSITGVTQALVYGKTNSILGNVLCAEVQTEANCQITEIEIRNILKNSLQDFKIPRRIKFVNSFSLTRTGKIKRS